MAWYEFRKGKRSKPDVQEFELYLEDNIFKLHNELKSGKYQHGKYHQFRICDPKPRLISKASVKDRLLHHAIYRILYPNFDQTFIFDSYSCRKDKGTHKAFKRLVEFSRTVSKNYTKPCWAIKLDIKKFFDSIDHQILIELLKQRIDDKELIDLLINIISSFHTKANRGIPIGNLTSQLFTNIYMDLLDKFVKHRLKARCYLRYADDFMLLSSEPDKLLGYFIEINTFLKEHLKLQLHQDKTILRKLV